MQKRKLKQYEKIVLIVILALSALFVRNNVSSNQKTADYESSTDVSSVTSNEAETNFNSAEYTFKSDEQLQEHFEKHGDEFEYATAEEYQQGAGNVINSPNALHKIEKEDGDDVYYLEETNEFVILSSNGHIRTYFKPSDGKEYFERQ